MRRWNGWGDENNSFPLREAGLDYVSARIGAGRVLPDASLQAVLATVPSSRMPQHPLVSTDPELRLRHARGQSLPDWYAMRSGQFGIFPDGVAQPDDSHQLRSLLLWARDLTERVDAEQFVHARHRYGQNRRVTGLRGDMTGH